MKKVTKENRLVLIWDLHHWKPLFSADAAIYSKVVCLNVFVQGTILIANAHCAYFTIVKVCSMHFVVCSLVAWNIEGREDESWWNPKKYFFSVSLFLILSNELYNVSHIFLSNFIQKTPLIGKKVLFGPIVHEGKCQLMQGGTYLLPILNWPPNYILYCFDSNSS